jgi:GNAT superfamily N-acetyltransferase
MANPLNYIVMAPPPEELWLDHLDEILALHDLVHEHMPTAGLFARETPEFFKRHLEAEGRIFGFRDRGGLKAYGLLGLPTGSDYNFGAWAGLPAEAHGRVGQIDGIAVHPEYRGHGLHKVMIKQRILTALDHKRDLIYSTAAPANLNSLSNLLETGFVIVTLKPLFGGHDRYILAWADHRAATDAPSRLVGLDDLEAQGRLFADGMVAVSGGVQDRRAWLRFLAPDAFKTPWSGLARPS